MTVFQIPKEKWAAGLEKLQNDYRLFGPVKEGKFHDFKALAKGQAPDLDFQNTRLSAKGLVVAVVSWKIAGPGLEGLAVGVPVLSIADRPAVSWK